MAAGVEFEEDAFLTNRPKPQQNAGHSSPAPQNFASNQYGGAYQRFNQQTEAAKGSSMERWLIRHRLAKSPRTAQVILFAVVIINIIISIIVVKFL